MRMSPTNGVDARRTTVKIEYTAGDYVQVTDVPRAWEGSGETVYDRFAYLLHVGRIVSVEGNVAFVAFPVAEGKTVQRNIELESLIIVGRPRFGLPCNEDNSCDSTS